jgi:hypothetical protein
MALRTFTDPRGLEWQVWDVRPEAFSEITPGTAGLESGWLVFQSPSEKRRLCPIPPEWETCPPERLYLLSRVAPSAPAVAA